MWSGVKYFKDRSVWPEQKRFAMLEELALIPALCKLPITFGYVKRETVVEQSRVHRLALSHHELDLVSYALAFGSATQLVENYFRVHFPSENTIIIAEDRQKTRAFIKAVHAILQWSVPERGSIGMF